MAGVVETGDAPSAKNGVSRRFARSFVLFGFGLALLAFAPSISRAQFAGGFASGFSAGLERGAEIRARHAEARAREQEARREQLCNGALENYLAGKGPAPPAMCNSTEAGDAPPPPIYAAASPAPPPPAPVGPSFTNCTTDTNGGQHCVTTAPDMPESFTNCTTDALGGKHCVTN